MRIYDKLFGDPIRAAETIDGADQIDLCSWMADVSGNLYPPEKCKFCMFECDRYGCERRDMTLLDWLMQEVDAS